MITDNVGRLWIIIVCRPLWLIKEYPLFLLPYKMVYSSRLPLGRFPAVCHYQTVLHEYLLHPVLTVQMLQCLLNVIGSSCLRILNASKDKSLRRRWPSFGNGMSANFEADNISGHWHQAAN